MIEPRRNLFCSWYPLCLNVHIRHNKRRFTCVSCRQYRPLYFTPEEIVEEAVKCGEFLNALFFGVDPYHNEKGIQEMKRNLSDDEMVAVPARLLKGLVFSFTQGMHYFAGTSNLIKKLDEILNEGKRAERISGISGNTSEGEPGTEDL